MSRPILIDDLFDLATLVAAANTVNDKHAAAPAHGNTHTAGGKRKMPVDFAEEPTQFVLHADLPGYKKDDISISVENGVLSLDASKDETKTDEKTNYFHRERTWGKVHRSFKLPTNASHDNAAVGFTDGVLRIAFPKAENARAKKLTIQ